MPIPKYRIDAVNGQQRRPGGVTFNDRFPMEEIEKAAAFMAHLRHERMEIVRVYEVHSEYIEIVAVFDDDPAPTGV